MFKAAVLSGFIIATTIAVQKGYDRLLASVDSYVAGSYGVLAKTNDPTLQSEAQAITDNYESVRQNY